MKRWLVGTPSDTRLWRRAFRKAEGLPTRGQTEGPLEWDPASELELDTWGDPLDTPGWSTNAVDVPRTVGGQSALPIPTDLERHLGKTHDGLTLPSADALVEEEDLPVALQFKMEL